MQKIEINNYMKDLLGLPKFSRIDLKQAMETAGIQIGEASLKATLQKLLDDGIKHNIYVIGDGPLKPILESEIKELHVESTFFLLGKRENPYPYIKKADTFVLFSYYEGYGMVLEEAKILGKTICITDTAAREALKNYETASIVENTEDGIYKGIKEAVIRKEKHLRQNDENVVKYNNEKNLLEIRELMEE